MPLDTTLEAILFATAKAQTVKRLAELCRQDPTEIEDALTVLGIRLSETESGIRLVRHGQEAELVTDPSSAEVIREAIKADAQGELSRPSLEALAVLAYRGPMTRPELEQIRGVQSSMILRNLMMRGLVEMTEDIRLGQPIYAVTIDFLKHIGVETLQMLPDYSALHTHRAVEQVLEELQPTELPSDQTLSV